MATQEVIAQPKIYPYLWFTRHDVHEVAKFYASTFPDSRILRTIVLENDYPNGTSENVTMMDITLFGQHFQLMQAKAENVEFSDAVSLVLSCDDQEELKGYENALIEAGGERTPGSWIIDPFGLRWHTNPNSNKEPNVCPCIWHKGEHAKEMAEFYASIFPDSNIEYVTPPSTDSPDATFAEFTLFGRRLNVMQAEASHQFTEAFSLTVTCDDQQELDRYWDAFLEAGGTPITCGWLIDHFGLRWQIIPAMLNPLLADKDKALVKRVMQQMWAMEKLEIALLEEATKG